MRKWMVALATVAIATFSFAGIATATPEGPPDWSHDRGDIVEVSANCDTSTGNQSVTFIVTNTSDEHTATIDSISATIGPIVGAAVGDVLAPGASENATITTSGDQTGNVKLSVTLEYVVGEEHHFDKHDSDDVQFPGGCVKTPPVTVTVPGPTVNVPVLVPIPVPGPTQVVEQDVLVPTPVQAPAHFTG